MNNKLGERDKGKGENYELRITNYEFWVSGGSTFKPLNSEALNFKPLNSEALNLKPFNN